MFLKRNIFEYLHSMFKVELNNLNGQIAEGRKTITKINDKRRTLTLDIEKLERE